MSTDAILNVCIMRTLLVFKTKTLNCIATYTGFIYLLLNSLHIKVFSEICLYGQYALILKAPLHCYKVCLKSDQFPYQI